MRYNYLIFQLEVPMVVATFIICLIILLPGTILVSSLVVRRFGTPWRLLGMGVLAFLVGEIIRNPIMGAISGTTFYQGLVSGGSPMPLIFIYAFSLAFFQFVVRFAGYWASLKFVGGISRPVGGGMTFSAGFSSIDAFLTFGFNLLYTLLAVISITQAAAPPTGVTPQDFATAQQQVQVFLNMPLIDTLVQAQILPAISIFTLQFAVSMIIWVGMIGKKWQWLVAGFFWQAALISVYSVVTNWMNLYAVDHLQFSFNLLAGSAVLVILMLVNLGVIYGIYKFVNPLLGEAAKFVPAPAPAKLAVLAAPKPKEKVIEAPKPAKKFKNTDLK